MIHEDSILKVIHHHLNKIRSIDLKSRDLTEVSMALQQHNISQNIQIHKDIDKVYLNPHLHHHHNIDQLFISHLQNQCTKDQYQDNILLLEIQIFSIREYNYLLDTIDHYHHHLH